MRRAGSARIRDQGILPILMAEFAPTGQCRDGTDLTLAVDGHLR
jgi:hypothetical protein